MKIRNWADKWLPIIMGCHCRPDRSFHLHGRQFPVCARCTGILCGAFAALAGIGFGTPEPLWLLLFMTPMIADGTIQRLTKYESTNRRRFITGALGGYAAGTLLCLSFVCVYSLGRRVGAQMMNR